MRYSVVHKEQTRQKLLQSSGELAKEQGFAAVGIDGFMSAIGLSGGAFYGHFSSKDELFSAIVERELGNSLRLLNPDGELDRPKLERCLKQYLNMAHVLNPQKGCVLPVLGAEIARADVAVREKAEYWLSRLQQAWALTMGCERLAWAVLAQCIGALVVARMLSSPALQQEVLDASYDLLVGQIEAQEAGE
ncbi:MULTISPECIES: TetR/AcrR family transcriptional regulator [unclassified Pseudomonas]|uniref:TetR/AcrR family transcriptional regulator n=1 Tax=unclassified Pseudomonas TaxID=196821 RepID=UPI002AC9167B|nr:MULTISPECIES: TetR/AcrR family transcriptional regulator [unclassified Pseudomonas]MEB0042393.1 TetR/AcrR family transcriptional regulator [Pseudomonas sp. MH10]MEB0079186.1 TetR/AcrR family transcriptional regulator [Pseudomonas sp. MH10out]MEB0092370.1 TetR/AcrR family transcriptional regulator [Pseudomonas sp. CCI4.2]MEB0102131.1 TetR/AcrR family transcriptional regulator [Pseudomonas sp. CCI3.2]MEB0122116.1 TetR/AcrR family transcriptional regulator [Pseudomonas sp. CCI1.2]